MRTETSLRPVAALVAAALLAGLAPALGKDEPPAKPSAVPLVRLDLLAAPASAPDPAAPVRDLFSPGRGARPNPVLATPEEPGDADEGEAGIDAAEGGESEPPALDAAYIGFVRSGRTIIALIVSGGQALAVAEGEEIVPGQKVERIAPDRIEVVGADGRRTSVPIQGEQP